MKKTENTHYRRLLMPPLTMAWTKWLILSCSCGRFHSRWTKFWWRLILFRKFPKLRLLRTLCKERINTMWVDSCALILSSKWRQGPLSQAWLISSTTRLKLRMKWKLMRNIRSDTQKSMNLTLLRLSHKALWWQLCLSTRTPSTRWPSLMTKITLWRGRD